MKKIILFLTLSACLAFSTQLYALTMTDVGEYDPLYAVANLSNSSAQGEADWINSLLGTAYDNDDIDGAKIKDNFNWIEIEDKDSNKPVDDWAFSLPGKEGYVLVKTGKNKKKGEDSYSHWLFQNNDSTAYLAVLINGGPYTNVIGATTENVYFNVKNIEKISHIVPSGATPVPEPATMMLFGIGLLGLARVSRKKI